MKTQQIMIRDLAGNPIRQNHKTLMFSANDMARLFPHKNFADWVNAKGTKEFCETIKIRESIEDNQVIFKSGKKRGEDSGTWVHPLLAVDLAMWLDKNFKYDVLVWVQDHLCQSRDNAGESYKKMTDAIKIAFGNDCHFKVYADECDMVQSLAGVKVGQRNTATKEQLELLAKLEKWNTKLLLSGVKNRMERKTRIIEFMEMDS